MKTKIFDHINKKNNWHDWLLLKINLNIVKDWCMNINKLGVNFYNVNSLQY